MKNCYTMQIPVHIKFPAATDLAKHGVMVFKMDPDTEVFQKQI